MTVEVSFTDGFEAQYPAGSWILDEDGNVHLVKQDGRGNVATISKGSWRSVHLVNEDQEARTLVIDAKAARKIAENIDRYVASRRSPKGVA
jgi:hypothetical protein